MGMVIVTIDCRRSSQHRYPLPPCTPLACPLCSHSQESIGRGFLQVSFMSIGNIFRHALIAYKPAHWNTLTISSGSYRGSLPDDRVQDLYAFAAYITWLRNHAAIVDR